MQEQVPKGLDTYNSKGRPGISWETALGNVSSGKRKAKGFTDALRYSLRPFSIFVLANRRRRRMNSGNREMECRRKQKVEQEVE